MIHDATAYNILKCDPYCDVCGRVRATNSPVLFGLNKAYYVCFDCYVEIGSTINDMIEGIKEANENGKK